MNAGTRMVSVITTQESEIIRYFVSHAERERLLLVEPE